MALKILSIDDEPAITTMLGYLLGAYGMEVITANTGKEGVELARTESPDLILLDMMMPKMDGWSVYDAIREFSEVPILAFSAMGNREKIAEVLKMGFDGYVEKPGSGSELVEQIYEITEKKPGSNS